MNILAPVNKVEDVEQVIAAGADEIYCGVFPADWKRRYTNIVSPNRREWTCASLPSYDDLKQVVAIAHARGARVLFTLNALYTEPQQALVREQVVAARAAGADALIVADLGLLLALRAERPALELHLSTGGTVFNSESAKFFASLGVARITVPRHVQPPELAAMIRQCPGLQFEVFILNSGCKNIDGFCTFLHGTSELRYGAAWRLLKGLDLDRYFLALVRALSGGRQTAWNSRLPGADSPCLLNYGISVAAQGGATARQLRTLKENIASYFSFLSGADPCGACRVDEFRKMGVHGLKIVGRNYSTSKKLTDVRFLKQVVGLAGRDPDQTEFRAGVQALYREMYGMRCGGLCYYPL
ncbi:MAG: U32 family peptidase [Elusimicrobia bacterium]|nr:U32 family peptidase [Elusimicrobiota bacterium]